MTDAEHKHKKHSYGGGLVLLLLIMAALAAFGIASRIHAASELKQKTEENAVPTVAVIKAQAGPDSEEIVLPGNIEAWHEAPIYARTNGYLKFWKTDIGTVVKAGDLLAEIDTPDVDAQYHQAQADLETAIANNDLAQRTAVRWETLLKTNAVSKQEADEKTGDAAAKTAMLASAKANLDRLKQLEDFKRVIAPFAGTITARNTDVGALINAGSGGTGQELFRIADISKLRVYVQVPENYAFSIKPGLTADLKLPAYPDRTFSATLDSTADAIDPVTRTLLAQFVVSNADNAIRSGGYAEVHLHIPSAAANIHLPVNALLFRDGMKAAVIDGNGHVALKTVTIGRDYGKEVEVVAGLNPGDTVVLNPPDSLEDGAEVHVVTPQQQADEANKENTKDTKEKKKDEKAKDDTKTGKTSGDDSVEGKAPATDQDKDQDDSDKDDKKQ